MSWPAAAARAAQSASEIARAKINLTLRILGRRPDGYHEIDSLVTFADVGDRLVFTPTSAVNAGSAGASGWTASVTGPFAGAIEGENLIARALRLLDEQPGLVITGHYELHKQLPVASGIGGGSADAAAVLRLVRAKNPEFHDTVDWHGLAGQLGADVPVCFDNRASRMRGIGDRLTPVSLARLPAVVVNPCVPVPADKTRQVFARLAAGPVSDESCGPRDAPAQDFHDVDLLIAHMRRVGNDLETAARAIVPAIGSVLDGLRTSTGCEHAFLSGAGPTCVGIYPTPEAANAAALQLGIDHASWWIKPTTIGG